MEYEINKDFSEYYSKYRTQFPNLVNLDDDSISEFDNNLKKDKTKNNTKRYLEVISAAILTIYIYCQLSFI